MEIIELNDGVIPFPASELERLKFLPYSLYDEKGFYYSICNGKIYKTSQDIFIESVRLIYNSVQNAKFPKAIKSMEKDRSKNLIQMIKKIVSRKMTFHCSKRMLRCAHSFLQLFHIQPHRKDSFFLNLLTTLDIFILDSVLLIAAGFMDQTVF